MLRYLTSGESHGRALTAVVEGVPANLGLEAPFINRQLARRQRGYGRGGRMKIESDAAEILSGVRHGKTIGSPVTLLIENRDWKNWQEVMSAECGMRNAESNPKSVTRPRPGHADLSGAIKYNQRDVRNVLERSSARETAARVAVGAVARRLLEEFGIMVYSWVTEIGGVSIADFGMRNAEYPPTLSLPPQGGGNERVGGEVRDLFDRAEKSDVRCPDHDATEAMKRRINEAKENGDSVGGIFEVVVSGVPVGLGSHVQYDRKLDAALAGAMMSIQAIKGVEIGLGFEEARRFGSEVHDEIFYNSTLNTQHSTLFYRKTNNAGGIEGGMSNGEDIVIRAAMKPIPTLYKPLRSVDIETKEPFEASVERSDVCAVPAAAVIGEAVAAFEVARAFLEKFGGDSMEEIKRNYDGYMEYVREF